MQLWVWASTFSLFQKYRQNQTKPKDERATVNINRPLTLPYFGEPKVKVRHQWAGDLAQWRLSHCSGFVTVPVQGVLRRDMKESSGAICR